jgi:arsenite oxidase small subunit
VSATSEDPSAGLSRRQLLAAGAVVTAGGVGAAVGAGEADAASSAYPKLRVMSLKRIRVNRPVDFMYPLKDQPNVLLDTGRQVPGGVGPDRSIVAYSILCQHMGCPVAYSRARHELVCPCHQSRYDPARLASIVQGVATRALPRVLLEVREGNVYAIGVDGLIYGYRSNLAPGKKVTS